MKNRDQRGVVTIEMNGQTFRAEVGLGSSYCDRENNPQNFTFGFKADSPEAFKALADYCNEHIKAREAAELLEEKEKSVYARCCASDCQNKAEWTCGTWQFCDECAKPARRNNRRRRRIFPMGYVSQNWTGGYFGA
jgi:hypothetical protein